VALVGKTDGVVSGSELYFYDSALEAAAVHAGLVKPGEKAVIIVTVVKCPKSSVGSAQNGVKSAPWENARAADTALLLQRRPGKQGWKADWETPRLTDSNVPAKSGTTPPIVASAKSPDGKIHASVDASGKVLLMDVGSGKLLRTFGLSTTDRIVSATFTAHGKILRVVDASKHVWELDVVTGKVLQADESVAKEHMKALADRDNSVRGAARPGDELRIFKLKHASARTVKETIEGVISDLRISADERTNSLVIGGRAERIEVADAVLQKLDVPDAPSAPRIALPARPDLASDDPFANRKLPSADETRSSRQVVGSGIQLDLVSLGTASIEARAGLRRAQAQMERFKALKSAVSLEELESAKINLDAAKEKVELLTALARSAVDSARAEFGAASAAAKQLSELTAKGYINPSELHQAEAQLEAAGAKVKAIESVLTAGIPAAAAPLAAEIERQQALAEIQQKQARIATLESALETSPDQARKYKAELEDARAALDAARERLKRLEANAKQSPAPDPKPAKP
jgi:hypothetical protein